MITKAGSSRDESVGCICNKGKKRLSPASSTVWVTLKTHSHIALISLRILGQQVSLSEVNLVFFDMDEICQSELISKKYPFVKEKDHANDVVPYFIHCVQRDARSYYPQGRKEPLMLLFLLVMRLFIALSWLPKIIFEAIHSCLVTRLDYSSSFLQQFLLRLSQIKRIQEEARTNKRSLLFGRLLTMIAMDVLAGVGVACIISCFASVEDMYSSFCSWTKVK